MDEKSIEKILKALNGSGATFIAGDFVVEKHVDHEIGNVEAGGIGIQIYNGVQSMPSEQMLMPDNQSDSPSPSKAAKNKAAKGIKYLKGSFRYRWLGSCPTHVIKLYQVLLKLKAIDSKTTPEDFEQIFSGNPTDVRIKWTAPKSVLAYFVKLMVDKQYVELVGGRIWEITQSRFVDAKGMSFANLKGEHMSERYASLIEMMVEILNSKTDVNKLNIMDDDPDQELWAGIEDRGWNL